MSNLDVPAAGAIFTGLLNWLSDPQKIRNCEIFLRNPSKRDEHRGWRKLNVSGSFKTSFTNGISKNIAEEYNGRDLVSYEFDAITDEKIGVANTDVFPSLAEFPSELPNRLMDELFDPSTHKPHLYKTRLTSIYDVDRDVTAHLFTKRNSFEYLKKNKTWAKFSLDGNELTDIQHEIVELSHSVDFIYFEGHYFVSKDQPFQTVTGFDEIVKSKAIEASNYIEKSAGFSIENMDDFNTCINSYKSFSRKLAAAYNVGALQDFDARQACEIIDSKGLPIEYDETEHGIRFSLDLASVQSRADVVALFADDYLKSEITNRDYIADRKRPV